MSHNELANLVMKSLRGRIDGMLLLSPFVKPGSTSETAYNQLSAALLVSAYLQIEQATVLAYTNPKKNCDLVTIGADVR